MWEQYYRDMIVFGMNAVELIPPVSDDKEDSPLFPKRKLEMMVLMSQLAADYGLDVWIWFTALDKRDGKRVDYSDEATIKESLEEWAEVFKSLPKINDVFVPGGDPGNTHPAILLPFMARQKKLLNQYHPDARIWVSPQNFDRNGKDTAGWYKAFVDIMQNQQPKWLDGVVFGPTVPVSLPDLRRDMPKQYLIRRYPDITHTRSCPYAVQDWDKAINDTQGREAINPRPVSYAQIFRATADQAIGFVSYSEGCNDDFNKILWNCLGWDPDMKVEEIVREFSKYFISKRWEDKFAKGLLALEQNWVGELKNNTGVDETLKLFQEMEAEATPQDTLNWRFQQALYRAYYDAYVRQKQLYELKLESEAFEVLKKAKELGASASIPKALAILERAETEKPAVELRERVFVLAEALFQSIRMQHSVKKYHSQRYANLDDIDEPVTDIEKIQKNLNNAFELGSEEQRLSAIKNIKPSRSTRRQTPGAVWPDWTVPFDEYQKKRSGIYKPFSQGAKLDAEAEAIFVKLPDAVKATFKREVPNQVSDIEIEEGNEDGETVYEVEYTAGNAEYQLEITVDGRLINRQIEWQFNDDKVGALADGWSVAETNGKDKKATWAVIKDQAAPSGSQAIAITSNNNSGQTYNLLMAEGTNFKDLKIEVGVKSMTGKEDQGGGIIWRAKDANNYYITRWNPLEKNIRLYYVKDSKRKQLASADIETDPSVWHEIDLEHVGSEIEVQFDEETVIEFNDDTFGEAGMVGMWTKADAATAFDDFDIEIELED
jgi:hypothetical protein